MRDPGRERTAVWGAVLFAAYLAAAFTFAAAGLPWEVAVAALPVGALLLWRYVAGRPLRDLLAVRGTPASVLVLAALAAAGYGWLVVGGAVLLGLREPVAASPGTVLLTAALVAPLVGGLLTALPEELVFRGFYLRTFATAIGVRFAVVASSGLFALAHLPNALLGWESASLTLVVIRLLQLVGVGVLMAWAALRTATVWFPLLWHAGANHAHIVADTMTQPAHELAWHLWGLAALVGEALLLLFVLRFHSQLSVVRRDAGV